MAEKIILIKEADWQKETYGYMSGWEVITDQHAYRFGIDNDSQCYENYGYIATEDDFAEFVGAELIEVDTTDKERLSKTLMKDSNTILDGSNEIELEAAMFITFKTSAGVFQLVVYNEHNGYYSHDVIYSVDGKKLIDTSI